MSVSHDIESIRVQNAQILQLLTDHINQQKESCHEHKTFTISLNHRVDVIEARNNYIAGAGAVVTVAGGTLLLAAWEKIKNRIGL